MKLKRIVTALLLVVCMLGALIPMSVANAADVPAVPANLKASPVGSGSVKLSWTLSDGATQYNIYQLNNTTGKYAYLGTSFIDSYTVKNLENGVSYSFKIVAVRKADGQTLVGDYSAPVSAVPKDGPVVPIGIKAAPAGSGVIKLSWLTNSTATQHNIYKYDAAKDKYVYIGTSYTDSYIVKNLTNGTAYSFKIVAVNKADGQTLVGDYSAAVTATAVDGPAIPADITATTVGSGTVKLAWTASTGATQYNIYQYNSAKEAYVYIGTSLSDSYTVNNLTNGMLYSFELVPVRKADGVTLVSAFSDPVTVIPVSWPPVPKNIVAAPAGSGIIKLSWQTNEAATQHNIYKYDEAKAKYVYIGTSYTDSYNAKNLTNGTAYSFKIVPVNKADGQTLVGDYSAAVTATAVDGPAIPANITATPVASGTVKLAWTASAGATQYNIYQYKEEKAAFVYIGTSYGTDYTVQNLQNGTEYSFKLVPVRKADGVTLVSAFSDPVTVIPVSWPPVPKNIVAAPAGSGIIKLSWQTNEAATQHNIYKYDEAKAKYVYIGTSYTDSYNAKNLTDGTAYSFKIVAVNKADGQTQVGDYSAAVTATAVDGPAIPSNITATPAGSGTVKLAWTASTGATQYNIYQYNPAKDAYVYIGTTLTDSYTVTNLTDGTEYRFKLVPVRKANNVTLVSAFSDPVSVTPNPGPAAPADFAAAPTADRVITLSWTASEGATQYNIYRYDDANGNYKYIGTSKVTSYAVNNLTIGTAYTFYAVPVTKANGVTVVGPASETATATMLGTPAAVQNLAVTATGITKIDLSWDASVGATQYNLYRSESGKDSFSYFGTAYTTEYTVKNLKSDTAYDFKVVSVCKGSGLTFVGAYSDVVTAATLGKPAVPENIAATATAANEITLTWTPSASATCYDVYRYNGTKKAYVYIGTSYGDSYAVGSLGNGVTYYFKIVPVIKVDGETLSGDYSAAVSATALGVPAVPQALAAEATGMDTIVLTWTASTGATQYNIYKYNEAKNAYVYWSTSYSPTYTAFNLEAGKTYSFKVLAATKGSGLTFVSALSEAAEAKTFCTADNSHVPAAAVVENEVPPTCTEFGSKDMVVRCAVCGMYIDGETVQAGAPLGHTEKEMQIENEVKPTCTVGGSYDEVVRCERCNEVLSSHTVEVDPTGHQPGGIVIENEVAATCIAEGSYDEVVYCTACGIELGRNTVETEIDNTNHVGGTEHRNAITATCISKGNTGPLCCASCGAIFDLGTETPIDPTNHVRDENGELRTEVRGITAATCTTAGSMGDVYCLYCEKVVTPGEVIPALGHTEVIDEAVPGNCGYPGKTQGKHCSVCGAVTEAQQPIAATGQHQIVKHIRYSAGNCLEMGYSQTCYECEVCHKYFTSAAATTEMSPDSVLKPGDHKNVSYIVSDAALCTHATCQKAATYYPTCTDCNKVLTSKTPQAFGSISGHSYVVDYNRVATAPTCNGDGSYYKTCSVCGNQSNLTESVDGSRLGHDYRFVATVSEATCVAGIVETYKCSRCGNQTDITGAINPDAHPDTSIQSAITGMIEPTCTTPGEYYSSTVCKACGKILEQNEYHQVAPLPHSTYVVPARSATCTAAGNITYYVCTACNQLFSDAAGTHKISMSATVVPATGHRNNGNYTRVYSRQTTCTVDGLYNEVCYCANGCGTVLDTKPQQTEARFNHMQNGVSAIADVPAAEATCTEPAHTAGTRCTLCGTVMSGLTTTGDPLGHDFGLPAQNALFTAQEAGNGFYCNRCGVTNPDMLGTYNALVNAMKLTGTDHYNYNHTVATFSMVNTVSNYNKFKSTGLVNILPDVKEQFDAEMRKTETTYTPLYPTGWIRSFLPITSNQDYASLLVPGDATVTVRKLNGISSNQIIDSSMPNSFKAKNGGTYDISKYRNISVSGEVLAVTVSIREETYTPAGGVGGVGANESTVLQRFIGKDVRLMASQYGDNGVLEEREEESGYSMVSRMELKKIVSNGTATYYFRASDYQPIAAVYTSTLYTLQDVSMTIRIGISSGSITVDPYVTETTKEYYLFSGFFPAT